MTNNKVTIKDVYELINDFRDDIKKNYVSKSEFWPVKTLVYGFVGAILLAVLGALIGKVVVAN